MADSPPTQPPAARTGMLIRRPVAEVFEAFVNPAITTKFWFTRGSDRLALGKPVQWDWEMYGLSVPVLVRALEPNRRLVVEWPGSSGPTTVEWAFEPLADGSTYVTITNAGFTSQGEALVDEVADAVEGFALVLAGLKAYLEHGIRLNLVADRYPRGIQAH
jgi:uncharacterized protein YndB with AHSA1/START domain